MSGAHFVAFKATDAHLMCMHMRAPVGRLAMVYDITTSTTTTTITCVRRCGLRATMLPKPMNTGAGPAGR